MGTRRPLLAATMIVKNEERALPAALASLHRLVDEVCVYDTGSTDATVRIAKQAGARVVRGYWDGDFSRARNEALRMTRATWAVILDADERAVAEGVPVLRAYLVGDQGDPPARDVDALVVNVDNRAPDAPTTTSTQASVRIFRPTVVHYSGRVHEQPERRDGRPLRAVTLDRSVLHLVHTGYRQDTGLTKNERNLAIAQNALDALVADGVEDPLAAAKVLLDMGQSYLGMTRRQDAVDSFETLREITQPWAGSTDPDWDLTMLRALRAQGTALLAQLLLDEGGFDEAALVLEQELRAGGADQGLCDWLRAQALGRLGGRDEALHLLRGIRAVVYPLGLRISLGPVLLARALHALAAGNVDEAAAALADAVAVHGTGWDDLPLLLHLWEGREGELADRLRHASDVGHGQGVGVDLALLAARLRAHGGAGSRVADALAQPSSAPA